MAMRAKINCGVCGSFLHDTETHEVLNKKRGCGRTGAVSRMLSYRRRKKKITLIKDDHVEDVENYVGDGCVLDVIGANGKGDSK